ncbi:MAG: peroxidase [Gallionellaceae bacterium]|nr:peroxidase [Gallionellaceae bacterium]
MTTTTPRPVELDDVQGLLRFGYSHHTEACFLLLRVKDPAAARAWLAQAPVTTAVEAKPVPATAMQVAISGPGLAALGIPDDLAAGFSEEFLAGMAGDEDRSRRLGDLDSSHPSNWAWGAGDAVPHVLLLLYALPGHLADWRRSLEAELASGFTLQAELDTADLAGREPFGFRDGLSQPEVDWERRRPVEDRDRLEYGNLTCLGEFLLGYPNEYGLYTDRPLLDPGRDPGVLLPRAEDRPELADLGRNGSYLVLRELRQDVAGLWRWLAQQAGGDLDRARDWAEAMVGRKLDGRSRIPGARGLNGFDYAADPEGLHCPFGAHIRRANPRNADYPAGTRGILARVRRFLGFDAGALPQDLVASTRFHRILRRGRAFGTPPVPEQALAEPPPTAGTGLHFICLGANIGRQFEFVQSAWIQGTRFAGLPGEGDPLLGHRLPGPDGAPSDCFSIPRADGPDQRLCGLPHFVEVRGGGYFFLPGIRALRYMTRPR